MTRDLAEEAAALADTLQQLPRAIPAALRARGKPLAEPIAARARRLVTGPYARVLRPAIRAQVTAGAPTVTVSGSRPVVSGGATVEDLARGVEYGGGRRPRTRQFTRHAYLGPATDQAGDAVVGVLADLVETLIER